MTGKEHIRELSFSEAQEIIGVLKDRMRGIKKPAPTRPPGGATEGQQRKVWHLMYNLADYDAKRSKATLGERLCGIIKPGAACRRQPQTASAMAVLSANGPSD